MFKLFGRKGSADEHEEEVLDAPPPICVYESINQPPIESPIASVQYVGATAVATLTTPELRGNDHARAVSDLLQRLQQGGISQIVLDAQSVQEVDSPAFSALVEAANRLVQSGGRVALAGAAVALQQAIRTTGYDRVFPLCDDVMAAMNSVERRETGVPSLGW